MAGSDERVLLLACWGWLDPSVSTFRYIRKYSDRASNCHEMKLQATLRSVITSGEPFWKHSSYLHDEVAVLFVHHGHPDIIAFLHTQMWATSDGGFVLLGLYLQCRRLESLVYPDVSAASLKRIQNFSLILELWGIIKVNLIRHKKGKRIVTWSTFLVCYLGCTDPVFQIARGD